MLGWGVDVHVRGWCRCVCEGDGVGVHVRVMV